MKTTVEIDDALMRRAKRHAKRSARSLRSIMEEGLRRVLDEPGSRESYTMPDLSAGRPGDPNPLEGMSWQDLRDEIYGGR